MKKVFILALTLAMSSWATDDSLEMRVNNLQSQIDRTLSKAGIHFNGEFRAQYLSSEVTGSLADKDQKRYEGVEYTSVDFDINARPNNALGAHVIFRMHQDWRNFFSDISNPIVTRWLSIDGKLWGLFKYNFGDYKKKISPYTLWSPEIQFLYEPEIFAAQRKTAMAEEFLGDNNRVLQGANLDFSAELYPLVKEINFSLFGARLRSAGASLQNGSFVATDLEISDMDKYLTAVNADVKIIPGVGVAGTYLSIFDNGKSYKGLASEADTLIQSTQVLSGRLALDNSAFMPADQITFGFNAEVALSSDLIPYYDSVKTKDSLGQDVFSHMGLTDSTVNGTAFYADLFSRINLGPALNAKLSLGFLSNGADFRNDAAQSPTFFSHRILNSENDIDDRALLNPFDAMYRFVFKFTPSTTSNGWFRTPGRKLSYTHSILERQDYAAIAGYEDNFNQYLNPVFQVALPFGLATPDRTGPVISFDGSLLNSGLTLAARIASLSDVEEVEGLEKAKYTEIAGGAGVDISKFVSVISNPLTISGAYSIYSFTQGDWKSDNNLLSLDFQYNFYKQFSVLFGLQQLTTESPDFILPTITSKSTVTNIAGGLRYKVVEGGVLTAMLSQVSGSGEMLENGNTVPDSEWDFAQFQPEVYLTVKF